MKGQELFYPDVKVQIGRCHFTEGISLEIYSGKDSFYDWAKVRFTKEFQGTVSLLQMDKAEIYLGYSGSLQKIFSGYVSKNYNQASRADEILIKDEMLKPGATYITNTFLDTTPQEIAAYALAQAGITRMELTSATYLARARVPVAHKSVLELLQYLQNVWGMGKLVSCIRDGVFYWGVKPPQEKIYQFLYGENIISLTRESSYWELVTVSMPYIRHSDRIQITHPKISGTYEVQKMIFTTNENGFIRTKIYF